jgi:hypothetical protein
MYGFLFVTPLAFVGLALTFARWSYRRTDPYSGVVVAVIIAALAAVAVYGVVGASPSSYQDLERRHIALLEDNAELVEDNRALVEDNWALVRDNRALVRDNRELVMLTSPFR